MHHNYRTYQIIHCPFKIIFLSAITGSEQCNKSQLNIITIHFSLDGEITYLLFNLSSTIKFPPVTT